MWVSTTGPDGGADSVIARVRRILEAFTVEHDALTVTELARATALPKSTVHRLCAELARWGVVRRKGGHIELGLQLFELGQRVPVARSIRDAALPYMEDLFIATGDTIHLGVPRGLEVVYVEKITGHSPVRAPSRIGGRLPLHCTAIGKAILAFSAPSVLESVLANGLEPMTAFTIVTETRLREELDGVRMTGVALEREEAALGVVCAAAPIIIDEPIACGAMSITAFGHRKDVERLAPAVRATARSVSRSLRRQADAVAVGA